MMLLVTLPTLFHDKTQLLNHGMTRDKQCHMQCCARTLVSQSTGMLLSHSTFGLLDVSELLDAWCERLTSSVNAADARAMSAAC